MIARIIKFTGSITRVSRRMMSSNEIYVPTSGSKKVYNVPLRPATMDDLMEPYGPWKQAYDAENRRANFAVIRGAAALLTSLLIFYNSGVLDGIYMPNLDNIMEETEPFSEDKEGRITV